MAAISIEVWLGTYIRHGVSGFFADYALSEFTAEKVAAILDDPSETVIVSENRDGIDGFARISWDQKASVAGCSDVEITTLYVQPRHQGRKIGQKLLQEVLALCQSRQVSHPALTANSENTRAIEFYQKNGFVIAGQTHFRIQDQGYLNEVLVFNPTPKTSAPKGG
ncbi:MAG: ribosomal protein S18 acetylase RimI-like enzyme [Paracoccaceae bacterium]